MARSKPNRLLSRLNSTDVYVTIMAVVMAASLVGSVYEDIQRHNEVSACEETYKQSCSIHQLAIPDSAQKDPALLNSALYRTIENLK